jgi:hypothetical protein
LQQRIGGDGGAMGEAGDVVRRAAGRVEDRLDAAEEADRRIAGVLATLVTRMAPEPLSTETISVKVPPVSMPIRKRGCRAADDMPALLRSAEKTADSAGGSAHSADRRPAGHSLYERRAAAESKSVCRCSYRNFRLWMLTERASALTSF